MLVLSRKPGERIMIGSDVELVVVSVQGNRVKLGFRAPGDVAIHRQEIHQRIKQERGNGNENSAPTGRQISPAVA